MATTDLIGTAQAAELLGIERSTLVRRVQLGRIDTAMKLPGDTGAYLFSRSEIERLVTDHAEQAS